MFRYTDFNENIIKHVFMYTFSDLYGGFWSVITASGIILGFYIVRYINKYVYIVGRAYIV
jgi:hypothetical protein